MELIELLKTIGLNKYESSAYLEIIKKGVSEASEIHKEANIPFGKIYETLSALEQLGLIEVQESRPKKYKAINPEIAYERLIENEKINYNNKLENMTKNLSIIKNQVLKDFDKNLIEKKFWRSAIEEEALDLVQESFSEVKEELLLYVGVSGKKEEMKKRIPIMINLIENLLKKGINIKILANNDDEKIYDYLMKGFLKKYKNFKIRDTSKPAKNTFFLIDKKEVLFSIENPVEDNEILGMIKIEDNQLINRLHKYYQELWKKGKKSDLEKD